MKEPEAYIRIFEDARPICWMFRPVLYVHALKEAVEVELNKLKENRVIVKIEQSDWTNCSHTESRRVGQNMWRL